MGGPAERFSVLAAAPKRKPVAVVGTTANHLLEPGTFVSGSFLCVMSLKTL